MPSGFSVSLKEVFSLLISSLPIAALLPKSTPENTSESLSIEREVSLSSRYSGRTALTVNFLRVPGLSEMSEPFVVTVPYHLSRLPLTPSSQCDPLERGEVNSVFEEMEVISVRRKTFE